MPQGVRVPFSPLDYAALRDIGWSVATYFVLPVLAAEKLGPVAAVRRSSAILRSKWGKSLAGETWFGLLSFVFFTRARSHWAKPGPRMMFRPQVPTEPLAGTEKISGFAM